MTNVAENVQSMIHGWGSLSNSHQGLINLKEGVPSFDSAGLHQSRDAGSGAFSPYHDRRVVTTDAVPAGAELFVDYGEDYFFAREKS